MLTFKLDTIEKSLDKKHQMNLSRIMSILRQRYKICKKEDKIYGIQDKYIYSESQRRRIK